MQNLSQENKKQKRESKPHSQFSLNSQINCYSLFTASPLLCRIVCACFCFPVIMQQGSLSAIEHLFYTTRRLWGAKGIAKLWKPLGRFRRRCFSYFFKLFFRMQLRFCDVALGSSCVIANCAHYAKWKLFFIQNLNCLIMWWFLFILYSTLFMNLTCWSQSVC